MKKTFQIFLITLLLTTTIGLQSKSQFLEIKGFTILALDETVLPDGAKENVGPGVQYFFC